MRILIVSGESLPGHENRNLTVCRELIRRGHEVIHTGPSSAAVGERFSGAPFRPEFAQGEEARAANTILFDDFNKLFELILWSDAVVFSSSKYYIGIAQSARLAGRIVLMQRDAAGMDFYFCHPDAMAVRSDWERRHAAAVFNFDPSRISATGSTAFDAIATEKRLDRDAFCRKYGLNPDHEIVLFLPSSPANHSLAIRNSYRRIVETVANTPGMSVIVKPHPKEFGGAKISTRYQGLEGLPSESIFKGFPVCEPQDKFASFEHSEVILYRGSGTSFFEAALFKKPFLFVGIAEYELETRDQDPAEIEAIVPRFNGAGTHVWHRLGLVRHELARIENSALRAFLEAAKREFEDCYPLGAPEYLGAECTLAELPEILNNRSYRIEDPALFDRYVERYCLANDGFAWKRVVNWIEETLNQTRFIAKKRPLRFKRPFQLIRHMLGEFRS